MLILNRGKKDYYDGVVGTMGIDKSIVYERNPVIIQEGDNKLKMPPEFNSNKDYSIYSSETNRMLTISRYSMIKSMYLKPNKYDAYSAFIVGFCGKQYVGFKLYKEHKDFFGTKHLTTEITYDYSVIKEHVKIESYGSNLTNDIAEVENFDSIEIFRRYNTPVYIYDSHYDMKSLYASYETRSKPTFIINPLLKDFEFYKRFDSFAAFQEIQMFLSGVLGNKENDVIVISDKDKIAQHGFDKFSFRKEKEEK